MQQNCDNFESRASYVAPESYVVLVMGMSVLMASGDGDNEGWEKPNPYNW